MLKMDLKKFLLLFVISIILGSCVTTPEIIYRDPEPPIDAPRPELSQLDNSEDITINEYLLMIDNIRLENWGHLLRKYSKIISESEYLELINKNNSIIDNINLEIEKLKE